jgi:hypothetical protein
MYPSMDTWLDFIILAIVNTVQRTQFCLFNMLISISWEDMKLAAIVLTIYLTDHFIWTYNLFLFLTITLFDHLYA